MTGVQVVSGTRPRDETGQRIVDPLATESARLEKLADDKLHEKLYALEDEINAPSPEERHRLVQEEIEKRNAAKMAALEAKLAQREAARVEHEKIQAEAFEAVLHAAGLVEQAGKLYGETGGTGVPLARLLGSTSPPVWSGDGDAKSEAAFNRWNENRRKLESVQRLRENLGTRRW
jgi:regulator of protease activity HflC (stomatin/prohibitin superfamily)